ncbi:response regulator [Kosakonia oryzendophytica]|uniref:response regulator n=1 Tax=Kosakonia TaxID=1330547 RepID=UPI0021DB077F|nr:response regulator [Kosakonia sp. ML.JS2a]UXY08927.1 response regulator [Kosakonia sp. ML.JS2a]
MNHEKIILVAEDDDEIADILVSYIHRAGMKTVRAADGEQALEQFRLRKPDLVLLDIQLPLVDGWRVLSTLRRESNIPVIMVTALDQDVDKLMGLRLGADDYVVKPFNPAEVVARIEAVLRRANVSAENSYQKPIRTPHLTIYPEDFYVEITTEGGIVTLDLTTTEFRLLTCMARNPRKVFSRDELLSSCLPEGDALDRTVDSHISKLRKKLENCGLKGTPESIRGIGYRLGENK